MSFTGEQVAAAFGLGAVRSFEGPVARGEQGQIWRLATVDGRWAVREPFEPQTEDEVREDAGFQNAARAAGVPTPAARRTPGGSVIAAVGDSQVRVYEWVDLRDPDPLIDPAAVGALVATLHTVDYRGERPEHPWYTEPVGAARWHELGRELAAADAPFAVEYARHVPHLIELESLLTPAAELRTCHRDLWADNLRTTIAGEPCLIDWDNCGLADPSQELAMVLFEFGYGDAARARALHSAYVEAGGPGRVRRPGDFSQVIAQLGHITEAAVEEWLDPAWAHERDRNAGRFAECVERPLTPQVIDDLLAAVR